MDKKAQKIIGNNVLVSIAGIDNIPAKVDTGADSSSLWASDINITEDGLLEFCLFDRTYPLYTGEKLQFSDFSVQSVRNSTGHVSIRYNVSIIIKIKNKKVRANVTLSDRSKNRFPVLIGRRTLQNKFLVDVSKIAVPRPRTINNDELIAELKADPHKFHQKYMKHQD